MTELLNPFKDVTELFEKRVKSRFSHRQIQLCLNINFEQHREIFANFLNLSPADFPEEFVNDWNRHVQVGFVKCIVFISLFIKFAYKLFIFEYMCIFAEFMRRFNYSRSAKEAL